MLDALLGKVLAAHKVVVDVVEAFSPGIQPLLREINELGTEATPEARLTIAANVTVVDLGLYELIIRDVMVFLQMVLEALSAVTNLGAGTALKLLYIAAPRLEMKMLGVFMSFPIILAAECFVAGQECAAVRPRVALHVFSETR
jgi:hypothetical protein